MDQLNWFILPISALVPLILGFIWYHPKVLGTKLALINGENIADAINNRSIGKTALIYIFSLFLAYVLALYSVHQLSIFLLFFMEPSLADSQSEFATYIADYLKNYGTRHRTFAHGLMHGSEAALLYGLPFLGISAIMAGKSLKSIWIHIGFWVLCCGLMGGLICAFL